MKELAIEHFMKNPSSPISKHATRFRFNTSPPINTVQELNI